MAGRDKPYLLPDFVGVGALKAGTSYLDAILRSHPELSMPLHMKEVDYFNTHFWRGPAWYESQFSPNDGRVRGEISPQYLFDPSCPQRISASNPRSKVIVIVRQPVQRAFSQYRHWVQESGFRGDFRLFLDLHPGALSRSHYWPQIENYRSVFPDTQIHVIVFEDLVGDPAKELPQVYRFLGVSQHHVAPNASEAVNASDAPRFPRLYVQGKRAANWLYEHNAGRLVSRVKATGLGSALRGGRSAPNKKKDLLSPGFAEELGKQFRLDTLALSGYLGRDLGEVWGL